MACLPIGRPYKSNGNDNVCAMHLPVLCRRVTCGWVECTCALKRAQDERTGTMLGISSRRFESSQYWQAKPPLCDLAGPLRVGH